MPVLERRGTKALAREEEKLRVVLFSRSLQSFILFTDDLRADDLRNIRTARGQVLVITYVQVISLPLVPQV